MQKQLWSSCGLTHHGPFSVQLQFLPQVGLTNLRMESNLFLNEKFPLWLVSGLSLFVSLHETPGEILAPWGLLFQKFDSQEEE